MTDEKVREDRLRRAAQRQGFTLRKSRRRDPRALDFGVYWLIPRNNVIAPGEGRGRTLDEVERFLTADPGERQRREKETTG